MSEVRRTAMGWTLDLQEVRAKTSSALDAREPASWQGRLEDVLRGHQ